MQTIICHTCSTSFLVSQKRALTAKYCSRLCYDKARPRHFLPCQACGTVFSVVYGLAQTAKYCSMACRKSGKNRPCSWCQTLVYRERYTLDRKWVFCSDACEGAYKHAYVTRDAHPRFQATMTLPPLTEVQQAVVLGSVLGDASLPVIGTGNAFFQVGHSVKQVAYLEYKRGLLAPFASGIDIHRRYDARYGHTYETHRFHTQCHWWLSLLRESLYVAGKKELTDDAIQRLTPCALAFWFMDDGGLSNGSTLSICTVSFSPTQVAKAANRFAGWGLDAWEKKGRLWMSARSKRCFRELIRPWLHESMAYKVRSRAKSA